MFLLRSDLPPVLAQAFRACREHLRLAAGLSALVAVLYLAPTIFMMQVYDRVVPTSGTVTLAWLVLVIATALGVLAALDWLRGRLLVRAGLRLDRLLAPEIVDRLFKAGRDKVNPETTRQALREFDTLRQALSGPPALALLDACWAPVFIVACALIHWSMGLLVLASAAVLLAITLLNERTNRGRARESMRHVLLAYARQERLAARGELVRALGMRTSLAARQIAERRQGLSTVAGHQLAAGGFTATARFARLFLQSGALALGALLAIDGEISAGSIVAVSVLLSRALAPIEALVANWSQLTQARQALDTIAKLIQATESDRREPFPHPRPRGELQVRDLGLHRADGGPPLLDGVSFDARPGEMVGIAGASGAGKTSLARLLSGAVTPDAGSIRIDGVALPDWDTERLAAYIGYLPQETALLPGTIAENISRFALPKSAAEREAVAKQVIAAAEIAGAHMMINGLPGGYDAPVGWDGEGLSAGQRQRVALARALYGDPALLVLDEPNSALDSEGEAALMRAVEQMRDRGACVIVIAHRSAILAPASRLLVLDRGKVDLFGPAAEVIEKLKSRSARANVVKIRTS